MDISDAALFDQGPDDDYANPAEWLSDLSFPDRDDSPEGLALRRRSRLRRFYSVLRDAFEQFGFDSPAYPISEQ